MGSRGVAVHLRSYHACLVMFVLLSHCYGLQGGCMLFLLKSDRHASRIKTEVCKSLQSQGQSYDVFDCAFIVMCDRCSRAGS